MIAVSHPTGNAFVRAVVRELAERGELDTFFTTLTEHSFWSLPAALTRAADRRNYGLSANKISSSNEVRELVRLLAPRLGITHIARHEHGWASIDRICRALDADVAYRLRRRSTRGVSLPAGVYCYEDCALATFQAAVDLGLSRFYDLPIAYWETSRRMLAEEAERLPAWAPTLVGTGDSEEKLARKTEEIALADIVICPSKFVYASLPESIRTKKKCIVAEFGTPNALINAQGTDRRQSGLRLLFVGSMTQRKGLADVFEAMKLIKRTDVELVVLGSPIVDLRFYRSQYPSFTYEPTRSNPEVLKLMSTCDVLVLPSIVEGRALVQQEAMAAGLPLIVTANAGGADLIEEGKTGFLVPIRSPQAIAERINWFADNREQLENMRALAQQKARELTWSSYADKILTAILATRQ